MVKVDIHVNSANAVVVTNLVEQLEQLYRVGGLLVRGSNFHRETLLEVHGEVERLVRSLKRIDSLSPKVFRRSMIRVFENTGLVRAMDEVLVLAPRSLGVR
jgi:hypothetical protein